MSYYGESHNHRGQYADDNHDHYDLAEKYHRHYDLEETGAGLRHDLGAIYDRLSELETQAADHGRRIDYLLGRLGDLAELIEQTRTEAGP